MRLIFAFAFFLASLAAGGGSPAYTIDTAAGSDWTGDGGPGLGALLSQPEGIAADSLGNLYIADAAGHRIRKLNAAGQISTVAGTGAAGFSGDGGPAISARLNAPYGLACDARGNLFIADLGNARVRRVAADGVITTIAGGGALPAGGDNEGSPAVTVSLIAPRNLALDGYGNLYISDFGANRVYRLGPDGFLHTFVDSSAHLSYPAGLALDRQAALYIADSENHLIRRVVNGVIASVVRATTPAGLVFDGAGSLWVADLSAPNLIALAGSNPPSVSGILAHDVAYRTDGYIYIVDGSAVRRISAGDSGAVVAGGGSRAHGDQGPATQALLNHPSGVAADASGNFYIADRDNHRIRRVGADRTITTVAGSGIAGNSGDGGLATAARLNSPSAITIDQSGNLYIADTGNQRVRKVTPGGTIVAVPIAGLVTPVYAVTDAAGNIFVADQGNGTIRKVGLNGAVSTVLAGLSSPRGMAMDAGGNLYVTDASAARVWRIETDGNLASIADGLWSIPRGVAVDAQTGDVLVADTGLQQILRVDSSGGVTAVAGSGTPGLSGDGGPALAAQLGFPWDVALTPDGVLYIADLDNNRVRRLTPGPEAVTAQLPEVDVVNAASLQSGPIAPGMLLIVRGADLDTANPQVLFDAVTANLLAVTKNSLVVQAPSQLVPGISQIELAEHGVTTARSLIQVAASAPTLFADPSGQAAATNADGVINSPSAPAARGSVIALYATGEGISAAPISVSIGGYAAEVLYAGPVAGYPGLLQVNARIPAGYLGSGSLPVAIAVGAVSSQPGVSISVQ